MVHVDDLSELRCVHLAHHLDLALVTPGLLHKLHRTVHESLHFVLAGASGVLGASIQLVVATHVWSIDEGRLHKDRVAAQ
jgi:hypothetical protein